MMENIKRKPGHGFFNCVTPTCRNYSHQVNDDYCPTCKKIAQQVQDNAKHRIDGNSPGFFDAMQIADRCFEIAKNPLASPEQLEWAIMILPDIYFYLYEPIPESKDGE
jgi:hypothetical protein